MPAEIVHTVPSKSLAKAVVENNDGPAWPSGATSAPPVKTAGHQAFATLFPASKVPLNGLWTVLVGLYYTASEPSDSSCRLSIEVTVDDKGPSTLSLPWVTGTLPLDLRGVDRAMIRP